MFGYLNTLLYIEVNIKICIVSEAFMKIITKIIKVKM